MYPLMNLGTPVNKETIDKIGKPFTKTTPMYHWKNSKSFLTKNALIKLANLLLQPHPCNINEIRNAS